MAGPSKTRESRSTCPVYSLRHLRRPSVTTLRRLFSIQVEGRAHLAAMQDAPKPVDLVRRLEEWVISENSYVLSLNEIVNFANRFAGDISDTLDMFRNEQQTVRVNMPLLDEAARLLWAPTRIALVHEAALVVHEAVNVTAGSGQALTEVLCRHFQDLGAHGLVGSE